jgi:hypothetical protein
MKLTKEQSQEIKDQQFQQNPTIKTRIINIILKTLIRIVFFGILTAISLLLKLSRQEILMLKTNKHTSY